MWLVKKVMDIIDIDIVVVFDMDDISIFVAGGRLVVGNEFMSGC
jgi:hypothetical protein